MTTMMMRCNASRVGWLLTIHVDDWINEFVDEVLDIFRDSSFSTSIIIQLSTPVTFVVTRLPTRPSLPHRARASSPAPESIACSLALPLPIPPSPTPILRAT